MQFLQVTLLALGIAANFTDAAPKGVRETIKKGVQGIKSLFKGSGSCKDSPEMQKLMNPPTSTKRYIINEQVKTEADFFARRSRTETEMVLRECAHEPERLKLDSAGCHQLLFEIPKWNTARDWPNGYKTWYSSKKDEHGKPYYILQKDKKWVPCTSILKNVDHKVVLGSIVETEYADCDGDWRDCL